MRIVPVGGRDLAVADAGPESGFPVVVHNGTGSRHLFPGAVADARRAGFRLIGYDRPGLGRSGAMPGRVVADCAADVRAMLAGLGLPGRRPGGTRPAARTPWRRRPCCPR